MQKRIQPFGQYVSKFLTLRTLDVLKGIIRKLGYVAFRPPEPPRAYVFIEEEPVLIVDLGEEAERPLAPSR